MERNIFKEYGLSTDLELIVYDICSKTGEYNYKRNCRNKISLSNARINIFLYLLEALYMNKHNGKQLFREKYILEKASASSQKIPTIPTISSLFKSLIAYTDYSCELFYTEDSYIKYYRELEKKYHIIEYNYILIDEIFDIIKAIDYFDLIEIINSDDFPCRKIFYKSSIEDLKKGIVTIPKKDIYQYYKDKDILEILKEGNPRRKKILNRE